MENIFSIKSDLIGISVFGNKFCSYAENSILASSEIFEYTEKHGLSQNENYEVFFLCKNDFSIFFNKEQLNTQRVFDGVYKADILFDCCGIGKLEIHINEKYYGFIEFEAFARVSSYKEDILNTRKAIGEYANLQLGKFIKSHFKEFDLSFSGNIALTELYGFALNFLKDIKPRKFKLPLSRKSEKLTKPLKKRKLFGFTKNIGSNVHYTSFKKFDVYNTDKNILLKQTAEKIYDFSEDLLLFYPQLNELYNNLKDKLSAYPVCEIICPKGKKSNYIISDFSKCNSDRIYAFSCFVKINDILSKMCKPLNYEFFTFDKNLFYANINTAYETKFVNTKTDSVVCVKYNADNNLPNIFVSIKSFENCNECSVNYAFNTVYKPIPDKNDLILSHAYSDMYVNNSGKRLLSKCITIYCADKMSTIKNSIAFSHMYDENIQKFFEDILLESDNLHYLNAFSYYSKSVDFGKKNVMVGVVKTKTQFEINIKEKFYYIPQHFVESTDIKYVAIYQPKSLFAKNGGIKYFGEVEKISLVKRSEIKEIPKDSLELYYRFDIKCWNELENSIKTKDFAQVCMFTNIFLLKNAVSFPELYIESKEEFVLHACIKEFLNKNEVCGFEFYLNYLKFEKDFITLYTSKGKTVKFKKNVYYFDSIAFTKEIIRIIYN